MRHTVNTQTRSIVTYYHYQVIGLDTSHRTGGHSRLADSATNTREGSVALQHYDSYSVTGPQEVLSCYNLMTPPQYLWPVVDSTIVTQHVTVGRHDIMSSVGMLGQLCREGNIILRASLQFLVLF